MIKITVLSTNVFVNLINGKPDLSGFQEPTKTILKAAFDDGEYEVIPSVVPTPIAPLIREIDARRLRIALLQLGYLANVEAAIASADEQTKIEWEFATIIKEDYPLVQSLVFALGLTAEDIHEIFDKALSLP